MKMRGVQPPPLGSVQDRVMTRMYMMEQIQEHETLSTVGMLLASSGRADKMMMGNIRRVLEEHRKTLAFANWSNTARQEETERATTDDDILKKVEAMGGMYRADTAK